MWKHISRGIRAPFERGTWSNRTTASTSSADQSGAGVVTKEKKLQVPCPFRFVPCFLQICQRHLSQLGLHHYEERNNGTGNGRRSSSHKSTGDSFQSDNINYQPCAIIGAVGWSGVLVLGWTILQPWYRHRKRPKQLVESEINPDSIKRYTSLYRLLLNPVFSQPVNNHILPSHIQLNDKQLQSSSSTDSSSLNETETKVVSPEEAFDEAAEEVRRVHEKVIGECENKRGVACLSHSRNHEAIEHFKIASAFNNAPAAFNLGQCYELGIGTNQDFTQAAHWYQIASEMGHASATYNLGVFYAHGWGGLKADSRRARKLFLTAAALGQPEAQAALNLEHKTFIDNNKDIKSSEKVSKSTPEETFESRLAFDFFKMNNISLRFTNKSHQTNISNNNLQEYKSNLVDYTRPDSSLPSSSSSPPSTPSSSPSSSSINTNEHPLMFKQHFSPIDESSETYSEASSEDEWQAAVDLASMNGNSTTLYRLAVCYENSPTVDPELILQLYRMAADHGHERAKQRLKVLEEHYSLGTLKDYLKSYKKRSKHSSVSSSDCKFHQ